MTRPSNTASCASRAESRRLAEYHDIADLPKHVLAEIDHFFDVFKGLEDAHHATRGWVRAGEARRVLDHAIAAYGSTSQG